VSLAFALLHLTCAYLRSAQQQQQPQDLAKLRQQEIRKSAADRKGKERDEERRRDRARRQEIDARQRQREEESKRRREQENVQQGERASLDEDENTRDESREMAADIMAKFTTELTFSTILTRLFCYCFIQNAARRSGEPASHR